MPADDLSLPSMSDPAAGTESVRLVAIGGSAGSLDSYRRFFAALPGPAGAAFVVVMHQGPEGARLLPELLRDSTSLPLLDIEDGAELLPDRVYVLPPGQNLALMNNRLLLQPATPAQAHWPIDAAFDALAGELGAQAVAVVLSGMGSDGTQGAQTIRAQGGRVFVQDPASAAYSAMPLSVITAGLADVVLPAGELAAQLHSHLTSDLPLPDDTFQDGAVFQKILQLVRGNGGPDFTQYKRNTIVRRIERRMQAVHLGDVGAYLELLRLNPEEVEALSRDLLINVTSFFRDPQAFAALGAQLHSYLRSGSVQDDTLRVWVAACATGEEAYSVAMLLSELLGELDSETPLRVQIFATDLSREAIMTARMGVYPASIAASLSPERLARFFDAHKDGYQVKGELREMVVFAVHNTFGDPPFTRLDLLCCRNLLIYLNSDLQAQVLNRFHYALRPGGLLFLGPSEAVGPEQELFAGLEPRWKLYRSQGGRGNAVPNVASPSLSVLAPPRAAQRGPRPSREQDVPQLAQSMLLGEWAPPAVVVDRHGEVVYVSGRTGPYLELPPGRASMNVVEMARDGLRFELSAALRQADTERRDMVYLDVTVLSGPPHPVIDLFVRHLRAPHLPEGLLLVVFREKNQTQTPPGGTLQSERVLELEREIRYNREYIQASAEEMDASLEELKSTNEELQTSNEELQSTNEELQTSKEELQSLNEELITINSEHQIIINDLAQANDDMKNLLDSAGVATVFLDNELNIKRFTPRITSVMKLIASDVGRPITDIASNLRYEHFERDLRQVLQTLGSVEAEVQVVDGPWYLVRIAPYRTFDNFIDGLVVVFTNVDPIKRLEADLSRLRLSAQGLMESIQDPVLLLEDLRVVQFNQPLLAMFGAAASEVQGSCIFDLGSGQLDQPELHRRMNQLVFEGTELHEFMLETREASPRMLKINARPLANRERSTELILMTLEDVTDIVRHAEQGGVQGVLDRQDDPN